ncbi:MAG: hypothetical protein CM15mP49_00200 [Actinomycetota bacterium]|nr:MAG: hypothetical protein CM15mP49_00200 [Actinomycetota bacterium]
MTVEILKEPWDELLNIMDYQSLREEQAANRENPEKPLLGIGFSSWLEIAGFGPPGSLEGSVTLGHGNQFKYGFNPTDLPLSIPELPHTGRVQSRLSHRLPQNILA